MYKNIVTISVMLLLACGSSKPKYATEEQLQQYTGPYYVMFTYSPKNSHSIKMGGIGDTFDVELLRESNLEDFVDSFYEQLTYTPLLFSTGYRIKLECLGLNKKLNMKSWFWDFLDMYAVSNMIKKYQLELQDGNYVNVEIHRISGNLDVEYIENYKDCIMSSSIEFDINNIQSINKVAVLLPKKR